MTVRNALRRILCAVGISLVVATASAQTPLGSTFTYQGRIQASGQPVTTAADFQFTLWTAATGGAQAGSPIIMTLTPDHGLFSADLDFGVAALNGDARWIQIAVRNPAGAGAYTTLMPRQAMNATPYSIQTRGIYVSDTENVGIGTTNPLSPLSFPSVIGDKVRLWGTAANHFGIGVQGSLLQLHTDASTADIGFGWGSSAAFTETMRVKGNGRVGIGTTNPQNRLHIVGNGDTLALEGTDHTYIEYFPDGFAAGRKAYTGFGISNSDNLILSNESATGNIILRATSGNVGINLAANAAPTTDLQVGGGLQVDDEIIVPNGTIRRGGSSPATNDLGLFSLNAGNWLRIVSNNGPIHFFTDSTNGSATSPAANSAAMTIAANGNVGIGTHSPVAKLDVAGVARCDTLEIDAGADVAENYDVAPVVCDAMAIEPKPGMLVSIDPREVGKLMVTSQKYDRRVAGIISGAGDVKPGLVLAQPGTVADGEHPVASMGRVWCYADADAGGSIEAGDILTTSDTPGHAMRAGDHGLASGATVGKAMSSLKQGKGLVLVLVSLQ